MQMTFHHIKSTLQSLVAFSSKNKVANYSSDMQLLCFGIYFLFAIASIAAKPQDAFVQRYLDLVNVYFKYRHVSVLTQFTCFSPSKCSFNLILLTYSKGTIQNGLSALQRKTHSLAHSCRMNCFNCGKSSSLMKYHGWSIHPGTPFKASSLTLRVIIFWTFLLKYGLSVSLKEFKPFSDHNLSSF